MTESTTPVIAIHDLHKSYGQLEVLKGVDLVAPRGHVVSLIGSSGSGKSTFLNILGGIDRASSGSVVFGGQEITDLGDQALTRYRRDHVGFVFQSFQLVPHLNALENVMLPLEIRGDSLNTSRASASSCLAKVGLSERLTHYPKTLSGGEQQRVALARAFVSEPSILFADEPTGSLDETSGARVIELLFQLNRENGSTLVLVTHDPQLAKRCSRQLTLQGGRLV